MTLNCIQRPINTGKTSVVHSESCICIGPKQDQNSARTALKLMAPYPSAVHSGAWTAFCSFHASLLGWFQSLWLSLVNIPFLASPALWGLHYSLRFTFTASYISVQILSTVCALRPSFKILVESSMTALLLHPVSLQKQYHMDNAYFICPDPDPLGHSSVGISF